MIDTQSELRGVLASGQLDRISSWLDNYLRSGVGGHTDYRTAGDYLCDVLQPTLKRGVGPPFTEGEQSRVADATLLNLRQIASGSKPPEDYDPGLLTDYFALLETFPCSEPAVAAEFLRSLLRDPRFQINLELWGNLGDWVQRAIGGQTRSSVS